MLYLQMVPFMFSDLALDTYLHKPILTPSNYTGTPLKSLAVFIILVMLVIVEGQVAFEVLCRLH